MSGNMIAFICMFTLCFAAGYLVKSIFDNRKTSLEVIATCEKKMNEVNFPLENISKEVPEDAKKHLALYIKLKCIQNFCSSIEFTEKDSLGSFGLIEKLNFEIWYHEKQIINALGEQVWIALKKEHPSV